VTPAPTVKITGTNPSGTKKATSVVVVNAAVTDPHHLPGW
jgi:hypothetical protein